MAESSVFDCWLWESCYLANWFQFFSLQLWKMQSPELGDYGSEPIGHYEQECTRICNVCKFSLFLVHKTSLTPLLSSAYTKLEKWSVLYLCAMYFVSFYDFSVVFWKCSDNVVFFVFLLYFGNVPTVWYFLFFCCILEMFRQCGIFCFSLYLTRYIRAGKWPDYM